MALALKNMKTSGANVTVNPDEFIRKLKEESLPQILSEITDENVKYEQWKKVEMEDDRKRTKIVEKTETKENSSSSCQCPVKIKSACSFDIIL